MQDSKEQLLDNQIKSVMGKAKMSFVCTVQIKEWNTFVDIFGEISCFFLLTSAFWRNIKFELSWAVDRSMSSGFSIRISCHLQALHCCHNKKTQGKTTVLR